MKKLLALILVVATFACAMVGCVNPNDKNDSANNNNQTSTGDQTNKDEPKVDPNAKSEGSMTYAEYVAADFDDEVVIEGFVQAKQSWWDNKATIYLQDGEGAYYVYEMICSEDDYNKLVTGTKIKVTGFKTEYHGEIEVDSGAEFEILEGDTWIAEPTDVTALLGTDKLVEKQNMLVVFKGLTVVSISYKGGEPGDDIYVTLSKDGNEFDFCVERYLTDPETDVYKAVGELKAGDVVDIIGFLYWYDGVNTHITSVTVK